MPKGASTSPALRSPEWFPQVPAASEDGLPGALVKLAIGVAAGFVFFALGARTMAIVVWIIAGVIGLVSLGSRRGRSGIARAFAAVGFLVGRWVTMIVFVPVYLIGFTAARLFGRISGRDPLHLRDSDRPTFWLPCDKDERKVRYFGSMFTTEAPVAGGRRFLPIVAGIVVLVIVAEILLRFLGFGHPILYRSDAAIGYYPAPNQDVGRYGAHVVINEHGMRSPPVAMPKPPGTVRILMLGDSTLYGGSYIDQDEMYARRMEKLLNERLNAAPKARARAVDVLAMGVNGWGPFHELGYVERNGAFDSDIAVVCLPIGDIYRPLGGLEGKPFLPETAPPTFALQEIAHHLMWRAQAATIGPQSQADQDYQAPRGIAAYQELGRRLRDAGCEVLFAILPSRGAGCAGAVPADEQRRVDELASALRKDGFDVDYPAALFRGATTTGAIYHDDCHLHREGHRLYAAHLAERVAALPRFTGLAASGDGS